MMMGLDNLEGEMAGLGNFAFGGGAPAWVNQGANSQSAQDNGQFMSDEDALAAAIAASL